MRTGYQVGDVMTQDVLTTGPNMSIGECAKLMAKKEIGSIVIAEKGKVLGILTEQDLARKVLAEEINPMTVKVSEIMSKNVHSIAPGTDIYDAMVRMGKEKIKHLPVINGGQLLGIISFKDIIRIEPDLIEALSFKSSLNAQQKKSIFRK